MRVMCCAGVGPAGGGEAHPQQQALRLAARQASAGASRWTDEPVLSSLALQSDAPKELQRDSGSHPEGGDEEGSIHSFQMSETMNSTRGGGGGGGGRPMTVSGSGVPADTALLLPAPRGSGKWTSSSPDATLRGTGMSRLGGGLRR